MISDPVIDLLHQLHALGVQLRVQGDVLCFRAVDAVPPDVMTQLSRHKQALVDCLRRAGGIEHLSRPAPCVHESSAEPEVQGTFVDNDAVDVERVNWAGCARKLIAEFIDAGLRSDLTDHYEETVAKLEFEAKGARQQSEMLGFGDLITEILRRGLDAKAVRP